jgi:hypothetical protein
VITLLELIDALNNGGVKHDGFLLKENDIVELNGKQWFVLGAGENISIRPVYTLSATNQQRVRAEDWPKIQKLVVNQLGDVTKKYGINGAQSRV